ncbi:MAG: FtsX-like permease family protein [Elusimicrobiota bacterium]|nr:FtsX-like permease family protein [Elusimicrobiota bacterium]
MNYFIKLAYKNLSRHKLRTVVSISAVVVGVMVVVFARGYIDGITGSITESYIHYETGHARIINSEYRKRERTLSLIYPAEGFSGGNIGDMIAGLEELEGVNLALPRIKFGAMATTEEELVDMMGWGVDPDKEKEFTRIESMIAEGSMVNEGEREVVMGTTLLKDLGITVGDKVTLVYNTSYGSLGGTTFKVAGRILSDLKMLNEKVFYLPLDVVQNLLYMEGQATEVLIDAGSIEEAEEAMPRLKEFIQKNDSKGRYTVIPWDQSGGMVDWMILARNIYNFLYIFILALASFVVVNTMIMVVSERTREIGMMGALGMGHRRILGAFLAEGVLKGVIGSFIGALFGGALTAWVGSTGINFGDAFSGIEEEILIGSIIYPRFSVGNMVFGFLLGVLIVLIASYIPARKAAKLQPTDALRRT